MYTCMCTLYTFAHTRHIHAYIHVHVRHRQNQRLMLSTQIYVIAFWRFPIALHGLVHFSQHNWTLPFTTGILTTTHVFIRIGWWYSYPSEKDSSESRDDSNSIPNESGKLWSSHVPGKPTRECRRSQGTSHRSSPQLPHYLMGLRGLGDNFWEIHPLGMMACFLMGNLVISKQFLGGMILG